MKKAPDLTPEIIKQVRKSIADALQYERMQYGCYVYLGDLGCATPMVSPYNVVPILEFRFEHLQWRFLSGDMQDCIVAVDEYGRYVAANETEQAMVDEWLSHRRLRQGA